MYFLLPFTKVCLMMIVIMFFSSQFLIHVKLLFLRTVSCSYTCFKARANVSLDCCSMYSFAVCMAASNHVKGEKIICSRHFFCLYLEAIFVANTKRYYYILLVASWWRILIFGTKVWNYWCPMLQKVQFKVECDICILRACRMVDLIVQTSNIP